MIPLLINLPEVEVVVLSTPPPKYVRKSIDEFKVFP